jgi:hypothetical protein
MKRDVLRTLGALLLLAGCGGSAVAPDAATAEDASTPRDDAAVSVDASVPVDAPPACDVSPAPSGVGTVMGGFVVLDPDAGLPIPPQTGGDPAGVWRFEHITIYTAPETAGMFDADTSTIEGSGWAVVEGDLLRLELTLDVALMGTVAGTVRRHTVTSIRGTFVVDGSTLTLTPECISPAPTTSGGPSPTFTAEGTTGTLVLTTMGMLGTNQIVLTGARTST